MRNLTIKCLVSVLLGTVCVRAQSISELESSYNEVTQTLREEQSTLDSLRQQLEYSANQIEIEKNRSHSNRDVITALMTHGVYLSSHIKEHQKIVAVLESQLAEVRDVLDQMYRQRIDSLKEAEKTYRGDRTALQNKILAWTEKRILLSPVIKSLSFDPKRVQDIKFTSTTDSLERIIYTDYLNKALAEVDAFLKSIKQTRREYEDIVDLRRKTDEFIEDVSEQRSIGLFVTSRTEKSTDFGSLAGPKFSEVIVSQAQVVVTLIKQLNTNVPVVSKFSNLKKQELSMEDYIQLLKQAEKELDTYRSIIKKKLK